MENEFKLNLSTLSTEDKCKIHLAEIYTLTKRNQRLTETIELFEKSIDELQSKVKESEEQFLKQIHNLCEGNEKLKKLNEELREKNNLLTTGSSHNDILEYYENKFLQIKL